MLKEFEVLGHDSTCGATEIIHRLLGICETCVIAGKQEALREGVEMLFTMQRGLPSFHTVLHTLRRDLFPLLHAPGDTTAALAYIASLQQVLDESVDTISGHCVTLFDQPVSLLTISRSQTVLESIAALHEEKKITRLTVLESRPMCEGVKTGRDLSARGVDTMLMVDAAIADAVTTCDAAVVGADSISADGFLLNKTGTHALALLCRVHEKSLYVLCDSLKFSPLLRSEILIEDHPSEEVVKKKTSDSFAVVNRYFDWTPIDYITAFITEKGIFAPDHIAQVLGG